MRGTSSDEGRRELEILGLSRYVGSAHFRVIPSRRSEPRIRWITPATIDSSSDTTVHLLGFETTSPRVAIHSVLGSAFYGAFLVKVILVRSRSLPGWALPVAGGLLFAILAGLWLTSALYLFSSNP